MKLPEPIGIEDVARLIGRHPDWLRKHLRELMDQLGFPPPILPKGRLLWHPAAVEAWRLRTAPEHLTQKLADELRITGPALNEAKDELLARLDELDEAS